MSSRVALMDLNDLTTGPVGVDTSSHHVSSLNQGTRPFQKLTYCPSVNCVRNGSGTQLKLEIGVGRERAIDPQDSGLGRFNLLGNVVAFRLTMFLTLFMVILLLAL